MKKKRPKETKEFEGPGTEAEESPETAQETRRQEFKGPFAKKMEDLCNNILAAKRSRAAELHAFMAGTGTKTKNRIKELCEETHDFLRTAEHSRGRRFKDFMANTKGRIKELNQGTRDFLKTSERDRTKKFNGLMTKWRDFIVGTQARVKTLRQETQSMLKHFETESKERERDFHMAHNTWLKFSRELSRVH